MLSIAGIWQLKVEVFVLETGGMCEIVHKVVGVHVVGVDEAATVHVLWFVIEAHVVVVAGENLIVRRVSVPVVLGQGQG